MSMERIISMHQDNQKIIGGEIISYNGEEFEVPPMSEEEITQMKEDGKIIGDIEITVGDEKVKLIDIDNGRTLFKRLQVLPLPENANKTAFWFLWRENQIEKGLNNLPETKRNSIKKMLGRK